MSSTSSGLFSEQGADNFVSVPSVEIPNGQSSAQFYYRDASPGTPTITAEALGQPTWVDSQQQSVNPGPQDRRRDLCASAGERIGRPEMSGLGSERI